MRHLSASDAESRRIFDWQVVAQMNRHAEYVFTGHRTVHDARAGRGQISTEQEARHAVHYRAEFRFPTLVGENSYSSYTIIHVDVSSSGYPFAAPSAWVVEEGESRTPWSPHFARGLPVCHGTGWSADGNVLLGHFLIHLARLLNWDEVLEAKYGGYNPSAVCWWKKHLNRPLNPNIRYPALPVDLLYGEVIVHPAGGFRAASANTPRNTGGGFHGLG